MTESTPNKLVDHFFRHQSGQVIASLSRQFGLQQIDLIEDMVQAALVEALRAWKIHGAPSQPAAWIYRVAKNKVLDSLRREATFRDRAAWQIAVDPQRGDPSLDQLFDEGQFQDDLLSMIFACCHPVLSPNASIPLTLKTVCGFSDSEVAQGLLLTSENVRKRIYRAKQTILAEGVSLEIPRADQLVERLHVVHNVLYLMFNEGYCSSGGDQAIRLDVCEEAARLCHMLTEHPQCSTQTTKALLALMLFHASRFQSRIDHEGALVLLEDQDRQQWDQRLISRAFDYLKEASHRCQPSSYHYEAAIAMYHCSARRFEDTNWAAIIALYDRLIERRPSPIYKLNRAIATAQRDGPRQAIGALKELLNEPQLSQFHLLDAALGELHRASGDVAEAVVYFKSAIAKCGSPHDGAVLRKRLAQCHEP